MSTIPLRVAIGCDHAGFPLKKIIDERFSPLVSEIINCGTDSQDACDFPDFAAAVAKEVVAGRADRGIVICGSGVGVCIASNKVPGIRASVCHDTYSARQGVEHDDMNVLALGGRVIGQSLAFELVAAFLNARFKDQGDFKRRVGKINEIEKRGLGTLD